MTLDMEQKNGVIVGGALGLTLLLNAGIINYNSSIRPDDDTYFASGIFNGATYLADDKNRIGYIVDVHSYGYQTKGTSLFPSKYVVEPSGNLILEIKTKEDITGKIGSRVQIGNDNGKLNEIIKNNLEKSYDRPVLLETNDYSFLY